MQRIQKDSSILQNLFEERKSEVKDERKRFQVSEKRARRTNDELALERCSKELTELLKTLNQTQDKTRK